MGRSRESDSRDRPIGGVGRWRGERRTAELAWLAALALAGPIALGALRRGSPPADPLYSLDRDPGNGRNAEAPDRAGRPRPLRAAAARRSPAVAGDGRRPRRRRPRLRLPAPPLGARHRRRRARARSPSPCSPAPGLAIIARYTMLAGGDPLDLRRRSPCSAGGCSSRGHPWRRAWQVFAGLVALMFLVWLPNQWDLDSTASTPTSPTRARSRATSPTSSTRGAFEPLCGPIAVPNHRAVPRLAFGLDVEPTDDRQRQRGAAAADAATSSTRPAHS